jgi:hypothetical protein
MKATKEGRLSRRPEGEYNKGREIGELITESEKRVRDFMQRRERTHVKRSEVARKRAAS